MFKIMHNVFCGALCEKQQSPIFVDVECGRHIKEMELK